jgi:hypothetical protein
MMSKLKELFGDESEVIMQAINIVLAQFLAMAENAELSKAIAKMCMNNYKAFQDIGFDDEKAFQLTMATMKNVASSK